MQKVTLIFILFLLKVLLFVTGYSEAEKSSRKGVWGSSSEGRILGLGAKLEPRNYQGGGTFIIT